MPLYKRRHFVLALVLTFLALPATIHPARADDKPNEPGEKNITHRLILQDKGRVAIVERDGKIAWEFPCPITSHDIQALPSGNFLLHTGPATVVEVTPEKKTVWQYTATPKDGYDGAVEIHAFQRLHDGKTLIAESGNQRLVEVDASGKITKMVPLTLENPNPHRDTRLARKLENGHYLVCHEGDGMVREYDESGTVVWDYKLDLADRPRTPGHDGHGTEVFSAVRLKNGNTLIGGGNNNRVIEVTPGGNIVWSVDQNELPGITLFWVTTIQVLPGSGNIVIGNTHAGPDNPQLIEITRDKKVVWKFHDWTNFGNDVAAGQILDTGKPALR